MTLKFVQIEPVHPVTFYPQNVWFTNFFALFLYTFYSTTYMYVYITMHQE